MTLQSAEINLASIGNWPELAAKAHYRVDELAKLCRTDRHTLRIFFAHELKRRIKKWMRRERIRELKRMLRNDECLKNIRIDLGYYDAAHLTHDFEDVCGISPTRWLKLNVSVSSASKSRFKSI